MISNQSKSYFSQLKRLPGKFWLLNFMNMMERMAFWVLLLQLPVYIAQKGEPGGLHWEQIVKGIIFFWWAIAQNLTPVFAGGFSDKYGFKRVLILAVILAAGGFLIMSSTKEFYTFLAGTLILGLGLGIYKPVIQGAIAATLDDETSRTGWPMNIMLINLAVFIGVPLSVFLKSISWDFVFYGSAFLILINLIPAFGFKKIKNINDKFENPLLTLGRSLSKLREVKYLVFLLLMSGFTMIYMQFYETLPNFIVDWTDSRGLINTFNLPDFMTRNTPAGIIVAWEWFYNINTFLIIIAVLFINRLFFKIHPVKAISAGLIIASAGFLVSGISYSGYLLAIGFVVYTCGEMITNPGFIEFMARIAPDTDKASFMGFMGISWMAGLAGGSLLGGWLYQNYGEKSGLALSWLQSNGYNVSGITDSKAFAYLISKTGLDTLGANKLLWMEYSPYKVFIPFIVLGILCAAGLMIFSRKLKDQE